MAVPLTWRLLQQWLQQYAYHTIVDWRIFAGTIAGAVFFTLLTVSYQAIALRW
jgi:putative ABC transport system permease protein